MNQEELKKLLQDSNQELAKAILDGLTAALKKDAPADGDDDPKPVDISKETDPQKLLDYAKQRRIEVLKEDFDLENADADEILEFQKALQAIEDEFSQQSRQLRKAKRPASRQRASDGDGNPDFISQELTKEEQDLAKAGLEIGKLANKISGRA